MNEIVQTIDSTLARAAPSSSMTALEHRGRLALCRSRGRVPTPLSSVNVSVMVTDDRGSRRSDRPRGAGARSMSADHPGTVIRLLTGYLLALLIRFSWTRRNP